MSKLQVWRDSALLDINVLTNRERLMRRKFSFKKRSSQADSLRRMSAEEQSLTKIKSGHSKQRLRQKTDIDEGEEEADEDERKRYQKVFLYMQPQSIVYTREEVPVEIELYHEKETITCLSETYTDKNIINIFDFKLEKPTFSMTIDQDSIDDITLFSDVPMRLTLYECREVNGTISTVDTESAGSEEGYGKELPLILERIPVAQGYIDLLQFFLKKRSSSNLDVILYPLAKNDIDVSCKMIWEIYSLMPLIKDVNFANAIFLTFTSIFNPDEDLMEDCEDLVATISFQSTEPDDDNNYQKYFICKYTSFVKQIISNEVCTVKWESLKNAEIGNTESMTIHSDVKFNIVKMFNQVLPTEGVDFKFDQIDFHSDYALICNSLHRYILTDKMHLELERLLLSEKLHLIVEIFRERDPSDILLEGFINLAVFLYPSVTTCNFAFELKPPDPLISGLKSDKMSSPSTKASNKSTPARKNIEKEANEKGSSEEIEKGPTFAIVTICMKVAITEPPQDLNQIYNVTKTKREIYKSCTMSVPPKRTRGSKEMECEEAYRSFDDSIYQLVDLITNNNGKLNGDNNYVYCTHSSNIMNRILSLMACDFNQRVATKNTIDFTNLLTLAYKELMQRAYNIVMKNEESTSVIRLTYLETQKVFITRLGLVKYTYALNNEPMVNYILNQLKIECKENPLLDFYIFLFDVERGNLEDAYLYLQRPLAEKDTEGMLFMPLIEIYLNYVRDLSDPETEPRADENLLASLTRLCETQPSKYPTYWVILYCVYKKYNYNPGTEYCRWKIEQLLRFGVFDIKYLPIPLWDIYNNYELEFTNPRDNLFWSVTRHLLSQGLYHLAQIVFNNISDQCTNYERYFFESTFNILLNNITPTYKTQKFTFSKNLNVQYLQAYLNFVNGNVEYARDPMSQGSMTFYSNIMDLVSSDDAIPLHLGVLRYGCYLLMEKEFEEAHKCFEFCNLNPNCAIISNIGVAKSLYNIGDLKGAERYFANSTRYNLYVPGVWFYLAIINFKMGENYKALECWRYARLNMNERISLEILQEIENLNIDEINLYVDLPDQ